MATGLRTDAEKKQVGHFLREWREYRGIEQGQLAALVDLDPSHMSRIENGHVNYNQPRLEAFARALGCRPGDILNSPPPADFSAIQPLWDRLDEPSRLVLARFIQLKVDDDERPPGGPYNIAPIEDVYFVTANEDGSESSTL